MTRLLFALMLLAAGPASAAEVRVLTAGAFKPVVVALAPGFQQQTGHTLVIDNDTAGALVKRIAGGEAFDLVLMPPAAIGQVSARVMAGPATPLARVAIGVAVKRGTPAPDIGSVEAFKAALLAAPRVAVIDPASGGSSGIYLAGLFERMGIADAMRPKLLLVPGGIVADRLVDGSADLAIHQVSEILPVSGAALVGPIPAAIQNYTTYAGAVAAAAREPGAARDFLSSLTGSQAAAVLAEKGMESP